MLIYFPHMLGQMKNGLQNTPKFMKKYLKGQYFDVSCKNSTNNKVQNLVYNLQNLHYVNSSLQGLKINIGGDHSMAIGTVSASLNSVPQNQLKVLWFDAHPDINTYESSGTKNVHGMPLAYLSGLCESKNFPYIKHLLPLNNLMYIGIRDIDPFEKEIIKKYNIPYLTTQDIHLNLNKSTQLIHDFIGNNPVHLSFDVDCLDPSVVPCTGTKVENGLYSENVGSIIDMLSKRNIINIDITELNLDLGTKEEQEKSFYNVFDIMRPFLWPYSKNIIYQKGNLYKNGTK